MADAVARLKVESQEFDNKIKRAADGLLVMEQACRRVGGTLAVVEKEELEFVKSLGQMDTVATSNRAKLTEFANAVGGLQGMYKRLTDEEKNSDFGRALADGISQLRSRAAECKDQVSDLNQELRNMASDTAFTQGLSMMASTIGQCASAMVAWTGDGKEMETLIRDLAKIQTSIAAVESLTKAFQKQNLVLLKNPYVAFAAGVAAIGVAAYEASKKVDKLVERQEMLDGVANQGIKSAQKEISTIELLKEKLHDNTLGYKDRKTALDELHSIVPDYHAALTKEGNLINDNTDAISDYCNKLVQAATAQAAFNKMVEIQQKKLDAQARRDKAQSEYDKRTTVANGIQNAPNYANNITGTAGGASEGVARTMAGLAKSRLDAANKEIENYDKDIENLKKYITTDSLTSGKNNRSSSHGSGGPKTTLDLSGVDSSQNLLTPGMSEFANMMDASTKEQEDRLKEKIKNAFNAGVSVETYESVQQKFKESLNQIEIEPIKIDVELDEKLLKAKLAEIEKINAAINKETQMENMAKNSKGLSSALSAAANSMGQFADESEGAAAAQKAFTIASAIAELVGQFAAVPKGADIWSWIAGTIAGVATLVSAIASIKSATNNYAEGGRVKGPFAGDAVPAFLNGGEYVLTANDVETANANYERAYSGSKSANSIITGEQIVTVINAYGRRTNRGEILR